MIAELPADEGTDTKRPVRPHGTAPKELDGGAAVLAENGAGLGSAGVLVAVFFVGHDLACSIRLATHQVEEVGTLSGTVYAASTVGSIAGVFITAYVLLDHYSSTTLFRQPDG